MSNNLNLNKRGLVLIHDLAVVLMAWFGAFWLRFNLQTIPDSYMQTAISWSWLALLAQTFAFVVFRVHRGEWRFASMPDLMRIGKAALVGTGLILTVLFLFTRLQGVPRSVFPLYAILLGVGLGLPRFFYRWARDRHLYIDTGRRALVVGAGRAGEMLVRDLLRDSSGTVRPVGFVDDKAAMRGREIQGVRILGSCLQIPTLVQTKEIDLILLALPSATASQMQRLVELCEQADVPFRTLPRMADLVSGHVSVETLRDVSIEDLLGRDPVILDVLLVQRAFAGKCVLVTGAGGSIGAELCRQVAKISPDSLVLFEQSEFNLFEIERELHRDFPQLTLYTCLGDVTDHVLVDRVLAQYRPAVVFHAAAYKHVPMLEHQCRQAARNNVLGTSTVALAADRYGVEAFVMISTDKAVNPANVMGASKRIAEIFCQNIDRRSTSRFITVRFGNVLGSAGSVVPLFREQIRMGGPVTVTHPDMERYFMTIPEACQLILEAGAMGKGGEIYVLDMGNPVKITYLAEQMIRLSGREPGKDIEITYTGLRPGEKLYEELFHGMELSGTTHEKILQSQSRVIDWDYLDSCLSRLEDACQTLDEPAILELIRELVPEMQAPAGTAQPRNVIPFEVRSHP